MPEYELNLRDYWQVIQKRRKLIFFVLFGVIISSVIYTNLQKPIYRAMATVQWQEYKPLTQMLTEMVMIRPGDPLVSQTRIINSQPVLNKVAQELSLTGQEVPLEEIDNLVSFLKGIVSTEIIPDTNIIRIYVVHQDPKMAAQIANSVAEAYIWSNLEGKLKEVRQVKEFLENRVSDLEIKLKSSEEALATFKEKEVPTGIAIPFQTRLADLEVRRSELLQRYTELHPDVKDIENQIIKLKEQLKQLPAKELEYSRLMRDVESYSIFFKEARAKLELARVAEVEKTPEASLVDPADVPAFPISPNTRLNYFMGIILGLMLGLACGFIVEQMDTSIGAIEDVEGYIGLPVLAVIPFYTAEKLKRSIFAFNLKNNDKLSATKSRLIINPHIPSSVIEAYHMADINLWPTFKEKAPPKIIIISSTIPGEGKTVISANLAITMAQRSMRVLVIDADLRRPVLYRLFGLKREPGLSDILSGDCKLKDALRGFTDLFLTLKQQDSILKTPGLNNLQFITPGHLPTNPVRLFSSEQMSTLIDELRKNFDVVIIDSPPVLPVSDVSIFSPKVDGVVLVYQVGKTSRLALQRAKKQLESVGAQLKGIILNCLNPQAEMSKSYYYYRAYKYYGERKKNV